MAAFNCAGEGRQSLLVGEVQQRLEAAGLETGVCPDDTGAGEEAQHPRAGQAGRPVGRVRSGCALRLRLEQFLCVVQVTCGPTGVVIVEGDMARAGTADSGGAGG
ncbi:hypothetical protein G4X40_11490 [Rhodococcus sp. D2-41]|uniref:hypothetical protein n=1 Tax=Speluncibacter jeojiensis TaxID=2710754 RepID=UPI00241042F9|nr:hypothetical protein [Rhodococcus sp. D2-41]MDG3010771.1 hypothetical protein [Rhodococcus sp. D2-41]